jgi:N-acetylneuraminic acid mutarotase
MKSCLPFFLFVTNLVFGQSWEQLPDIPAPGRDDGASFCIDGIAYVVTGNQNGFAQSNRLWALNLATNTWSEKSPFPGEPRQYAGTFVLQNKAYLLCGYSSANQPLKDVWQYSPETDTWVQKKDFEGAPRWTFFQFTADNFGFIGTGASPDSSLADCWKYDPIVDDWTPIADFPGGRMREVVGFSMGDKGFAGSGLNVNPLTFYSEFYEYDIQKNTWKQINDYPGGACSYLGAQGVGLKALVGGGWSNGGNFRTDFYTLSIDGAWTEAPSAPIQGWRGMSTFGWNGKAYFLGGLYEDVTRTSNVFALNLEQEYFPVLFPNPSEKTSVIYYLPNSEVKVYDNLGQLSLSLFTDADGYCRLPEVPAGSYIIKLPATETTEYVLKWFAL